MQILPQQPSSIAKILDASVKLFTAAFTRIIGFGLIITALYMLLSLSIAAIFSASPPSGNPDAAMAEFRQTMPLFIALVVAVEVLSLIFYSAIVYRLDNFVQQRDESFGEALAVGLKKFPALLLASLLYGLALFVGFLLLAVPGIVLLLSLSFYPLFIVVENLGGYAALRASHRMVWGQWWRTLSTYMAPGILVTIFYIALGLITYPLNGEAGQAGSVSVGDLLVNLFSGVVMPYFCSLAYVLYHDLKLRKSGGDLASRLA